MHESRGYERTTAITKQWAAVRFVRLQVPQTYEDRACAAAKKPLRKDYVLQNTVPCCTAAAGVVTSALRLLLMLPADCHLARGQHGPRAEGIMTAHET